MFPALRQRLALGLTNFIAPELNKFHEAFLKHIGGSYTKYDHRAKEEYLNKGFLYNPDVYAVIQQQATKASSIPWRVKIIKDQKEKSKLDRFDIQVKGNMTPQQRVRRIMLETKAFDEVEMDFPMERPNVLQTWPEVKALVKVFLKTTGNIYYYAPSPKEGANKGVPRYVYVLPSHLMNIVVKKKFDFEDDETPVQGYLLVEGNKWIEFDESEVIHVKYPNPEYDLQGSHLYGLSPLRAALRNIQSSNEAIDNNNRTLLSSGAFGFIHSKGQNVMTPEQAREIKSRLQEMDSDKSRLAKITGVSAELGFTQIALTTDQLKPFDFLKFDQKAICNVLGWSDLLLNNDARGDYGGTINQMRKQVITDNIMPDNILIDAAIQEGILRKFRGYERACLESVYDELPEMQEDMSEMAKWVGELIDKGVFSRDEARQFLKAPMLGTPEMQAYTVTSDVIPLSEAIDENFRLNPQNTGP